MKKTAATIGKEAAKDAAELAVKDGAEEIVKSSAKDKALKYGMGALDVLSGGADVEDNGTWANKLQNWGGTAGSLVGGVAGTAIPIPVVGSAVGGMAGGFGGRRFGKALGTAIDRYINGDKIGAVKSVGKMIAMGLIPGAMLVDYATEEDNPKKEDAMEDMLTSVKDEVPEKYKDDVEDAIEAVD